MSNSVQLTMNGGDTVYNWIHPDNRGIVLFLRKRGYKVLDLIESRRPRMNEKLASRIQVGEYESDY